MPLAEVALTAATLLGTGAVGGLAGEAGKGAWHRLTQLATLVHGKLRDDEETKAVLDRIAERQATDADIATLATAIDRHATADSDFRAALADAVRDAERDPSVGHIVVQVRDRAHVGKITNIDTVHGNITI